MNPVLRLVPDARFRQQWEFRDGRSELSSDDSLSNNHDKPEVRDSPASLLPLPVNDQLKACKSGAGKTKKVKSAKKKWREFVNFGGMDGIFDISISNELQVHIRLVMEDLDAERQKMSMWMREEVEKMSGKGVALRGRGKNGVLGHSRTRKSTGRSRSQGPNEIKISLVPVKDGNNGENQKAADPNTNIGHNSTSIPLDVRNILVGPVGRDTGSSSSTFRLSNEQSSIYYSPPNGFLNFSATIPRCSASPLIPNGLNHSMAGSRPTNPGFAKCSFDSSRRHEDVPTNPASRQGCAPCWRTTNGEFLEQLDKFNGNKV